MRSVFFVKSKIFLVQLSMPAFSDGYTRNPIHMANNFKSFYCSYTTPQTLFLSATKLFYKIWLTKEKLIFFVQNIWFNLLSTYVEPLSRELLLHVMNNIPLWMDFFCCFHPWMCSNLLETLGNFCLFSIPICYLVKFTKKICHCIQW